MPENTHIISIMRGESIIVEVEPNESSQLVKKIMGENNVTLSFVLDKMINFRSGDYAVFYGETFVITKLPTVEKQSLYRYEYSMQLFGLEYILQNAQYLFYDSLNNLTNGDFSLTGTAMDFIDLLVTNANRVSAGWIKGGVIATDYKTLTFSKNDCLTVLSKLAEEFGTEYYIQGRTIHLAKKQVQKPYIFKYGKNKGLYTITRSQNENLPLITRLYVYGSDRNIAFDYRDGAQRLLMPSGDAYIEQNISEYGIIENTIIFEDIYPRRTGVITSVDITNVYKFKDTSIDFNINDYLLPGLSAKVTFNTGQLAGYTFEISAYDNVDKEVTILKNKDEISLDIPSALLKPAIGDQYVLTDITMPQSYIDAAETELLFRATEYLTQYSSPQYEYQISCDPAYFRRNNIVLSLGDLVYIEDSELGINRFIRIIELTKSLADEFQYDIKVGNEITYGTLSQLISTTNTNTQSIGEVQQKLINNALLSGTFIGTFKIEQGSIIISGIEAADTTGMKALYIDNSGNVFKSL